MKILKLIIKNSMRHKLRALLTVIGIAIAVIAFGLLRTVVTAYYAGVEGSNANRLVTRHAVSFIFPLPYAYKDKIEKIPGVTKTTYFNWFGGVYKDKNNFFSRMACDPETVFDVYPEFVVSDEVKAQFKKERNACIVGSDIAKQFGFKVGDAISLDGDIYPGKWDFIIRGIYTPRDKSTDATQMLFSWQMLNERMIKETPGRANEIGWFIVQIKDADKSAEISERIDNLFKNSSAETKSETERAFQQSFIAASGAIITAMNFISFVIIGIILLVLGNTMIMSARERTREYAVMKTLGFTAKHLVALIMGEAMFISFLGGALGLGLLFPLVAGFETVIPKGFFPIFAIENSTIILAALSAILIGLIASVIPIYKAINTKIVDGFRFVG